MISNDYFSEIGKNISLPKGVFYWTDRAKKEAEINATIGTAVGMENEFLQTDSKRKVTFYIPYIKEILSSCDSEEIFPYAPILGVKKFRELWREWIVYKMGERAENVKNLISVPMVVPGATSGIYIVLKLFLSPGEIVISSDKRWENYDTVIKGNSGLRIKSFKMFSKNDLNISSLLDTMEAVAKEQNKIVLLINFPNNPTGYSPLIDGAEALKRALFEFHKKKGIPLIIIFDDAYEGFVYEDRIINHSLFNYFVNLAKDIIPVKIDGLSKEFLLYGARIAAVTFGFSQDIDIEKTQSIYEDKIGALIRGTFSNSNHLIQSVAVKFLSNRDVVIKQRQKIIELLKKRYLLLNEYISDLKSELATVDPFNSGFFGFLNLNGIDSFEFAEKLLSKYRTGIVPIKDEETGVNGVRMGFCSLLENEVNRFVESIIKAINDFK